MNEPKQADIFAEKPKEGEPWDVAIVGSGPSALTAAIYSVRGAASTLILGGTTWGGQLMLTTDVDNFPGFPESIQGPELIERMRAQAERFGSEFVMEDVSEVRLDNSPFELSAGGKNYKAKAVIIATGSQTKWLGVEGEDRLRGKGVSSCAPCDAPFFKDKKVIVVGGGDAAMEEALVLTKYASEVTLAHRRDSFKASQAMQQRVMSSDKIKIVWDTEVVEMLGEQRLSKVRMKTTAGTEQAGKIEGGEEHEGAVYWNMPAEGLFVAIGHNPATDIFKGKIELDQKGYVVKKPQDEHGFMMSTSIPGVFVAGDVHDYHYQQAVTAAGFGCMAGMEALKYLDKESPSY